MSQIEVTLEGLSPLLMNRMLIDSQDAHIEKLTEEEREEQAKKHAYIDKKGKYYLPGEALQRCIIGAGAFSKGKGRGNLSKIVAACVQVEDMEIPLHHDEPFMDTRLRVIPATKGRTLVCRMCIPKNWSAKVMITYDEKLISVSQLQEILDSAGARVGLLDWRPATKGSFGRFRPIFSKSKSTKIIKSKE